MNMLEWLARVLAAAVSVTVVLAFLRELTLRARLRRRDTFYREASSGDALTQGDRDNILTLRRLALARLVARDSHPLSSRRYAWGGLLVGLYATGSLAFALTSFFEEGYDQLSLNTGGFGWLFLVIWPMLGLAPVVHAVQAWRDLRAQRQEAERAFIEGDEPRNVRRIGVWSYNFWTISWVEARASMALISVALFAGVFLEMKQVGGEPSRGTSFIILVAIVLLSTSFAPGLRSDRSEESAA